MIKILHIAPHVGGGVGRVLASCLKAAPENQSHRAACLEEARGPARGWLGDLGLDVLDRVGRDLEKLYPLMAEADIVVLHWWNHPLAYNLLMNGRWPATRLLIWSHVSGLFAPQSVGPELADFADLFAAASPASFKNAALKNNPKTRLIFSSAGIGSLADVRADDGPGFNIGYLGTVDQGKMHPRFLDLCLGAGLGDRARFLVAGGPKHEKLRAEVKARGLEEIFYVLGPIDDVAGFFAKIKIFAYPLNPRHYGTGEQVLIEAQAAGVPPVVLAGGAEEFVVEHGQTGLAADGEADFGRCLARLHQDDDLRERLSAQARRRAKERFAIERTAFAFDGLYEELMRKGKQERHWNGRTGTYGGTDIFLASQNELRSLFISLLENGSLSPGQKEALGDLSFSRTRGSVFHYLSFFPEEKNLKRLADILAAASETGA